MALIKCPECEKEISDKASACIYCGFPLLKNEDNNSNQKLEKEDRFNIILNSNYNKIEPIKLIMELKGISLSDSKDIVDNCPVVIFENLSSNETENIVNKFMTIGSDIVTENLEESNIVRSERNAENKTEEITKTESIINTTDNNIKRNNKGCSVAIIITIVIIFLLAFLGSRTNHNDGKCDICGDRNAIKASSDAELCLDHILWANNEYYKDKENYGGF